MKPSLRLAYRLFSLMVLILVDGAMASAQIVPTNDPPVYGPYNAVILQGGDGVHKKMVEQDTVLACRFAVDDVCVGEYGCADCCS